MLAHVNRSHRHDGDHGDLRQDHDGRADHYAIAKGRDSFLTDHASWGGRNGFVINLVTGQRWSDVGESFGQHIRIRPEEREEGGRRSQVGNRGEQKWPGQRGDTKTQRKPAQRFDQVRSGDGAQCRGNHRDADCPTSLSRKREVGSGVTCLQVGGGPGAVDE